MACICKTCGAFTNLLFVSEVCGVELEECWNCHTQSLPLPEKGFYHTPNWELNDCEKHNLPSALCCDMNYAYAAAL